MEICRSQSSSNRYGLLTSSLTFAANASTDCCPNESSLFVDALRKLAGSGRQHPAPLALSELPYHLAVRLFQLQRLHTINPRCSVLARRQVTASDWNISDRPFGAFMFFPLADCVHTHPLVLARNGC